MGRFRILEHCRGTQLAKAQLQRPDGAGWTTVATSSPFPCLPWRRKSYNVVQNTATTTLRGDDRRDAVATPGAAAPPPDARPIFRVLAGAMAFAAFLAAIIPVYVIISAGPDLRMVGLLLSMIGYGSWMLHLAWTGRAR